MIRGLLITGAAFALVALAAGLWVTRPQRLDAVDLDGPAGDAARGEAVFWAAGCASCHSAVDAEGAGRLVLSGGQPFPSDFGTFYAPNVTPDPEAGIGGWSFTDFANAVQRGISPDGQHYYPAFPYTAYALAETSDIADLWAFWQTLPASDVPSRQHDVRFPFSVRRTIGAWKALYMPHDWITAVEGAQAERGRYLAEALGHCAECHTPRGPLGGLDRDHWLGGAPNPTGRGSVPDITPSGLAWSEDEIAAYLADGFTPDFDSAGGHMAAVVRNLSNLPDGDRAAIAAYLKQVPPSAAD